jgi:hypothetical protein
MITQASSEHSICIGINSSDVELAKKQNYWEVFIRNKIKLNKQSKNWEK